MRTDRRFEILAWIAIFALTNTVNATSRLMEQARQGPLTNIWEPFLFEYSSAIGWLALIPAILWLDRRYPFRPESWKSSMGVHLLATIPASLVHVTIMVWVRKLCFALVGKQYDFGNVPVELVYEFRKDLLTYFFILGIVYGYRMFLANRSGAAYPDDTEPSGQFLVRKSGRVSRVSPASIDWVEAAGNYVILHAHQASHPLRDTMKGIADRLGVGFFRIHRSTIVNLSRVRNVRPTSNGDLAVMLDDETELKCSRSMRAAFESALASEGQSEST